MQSKTRAASLSSVVAFTMQPMTRRYLSLCGVVFASMFAGAFVASRVIRPDLTIPVDEQQIAAIASKSTTKGSK